MKKLLVSLLMLVAMGAFACGGSDDNNNTTPTDTTNEDTTTEDTAIDCGTVCVDKCGDFEGCDCGGCDTGFTCTNNVCMDETCATACEGLECGTVDACECGTCETGNVCTDNMCVPEGTDCEAVCADKECGEVDGCTCGTECEAGFACNETTYVCECVPTCVDAETGDEFACGDDGCGGTCGTCGFANDVCEDHVCVCTADCTDKECGTDGCGGTCGDCTDGFTCDSNQACVPTCDKTAITFTGDMVQKVNYMDVGVGGHPGEALDVDNDPATCAPAADCEGGYNNQLSGLLSQLSSFVDVTAELEGAISGGSVILLVEAYGYADDGSEFTLKFYLGDAVAVDANGDPTCDLVSDASCHYTVQPMSFDDITCDPIIMFENATVTGDLLVAGGPANKFTVAIPISEGAPPLSVTADMAQINATVGDAVLTGGLIGGAVKKQTIMDAVDALPEDMDLPIPKDMIKNLLNTFIQPDIDSDGDAELDAASIGIKFTTMGGMIDGMTAE